MTDLRRQLETMASKHPHMRIKDALARLKEAETRKRLIAECMGGEKEKRAHGPMRAWLSILKKGIW